jgi:germination protein M
MKNKQRLIPLLIGSSLFVAIWIAGCSKHSGEPPHLIAPSPPVTTPVPPPAPTPQTTPPKKGVVYVPSGGQSGGDQNDLVPISISFDNPDQPALSSIKYLINTPNSPIPNGTKVKRVKIVDGLATVDFSHEFRDNFHGGGTEEAQTINSVLKTLGQFPDIQQVQILVEGKPIDALSNLEISKPLDVIRPENGNTESSPKKADDHT